MNSIFKRRVIACATLLTFAFFGVACGGEQTTAVASDCPAGQTLCSDGCYTLQSSPESCGTCGNACAGGEVCSDGVCEVQCAAGLIACDGGCIDPQTSGEYCGASGDCAATNSGETCSETEVCSGGSCQLTCTGGTILCDGTCVDPLYDPDYCGATAGCSGTESGRVCSDSQVCDEGVCRSECGAGLVICEGGCIDPMTNPRFCGASNACVANEAGDVCEAGEACLDGACVPNCAEGQVACNGSCIDPMTNPRFCGASDTCTGDEAGRSCGVDNACLGGACFPTDAIFVSPRDYASGEWSYPRAVDFQFGSFIDNTTIHYTLDGTDPAAGAAGTQTATPPFEITGVGDVRTVRYVIEYNGEFSDVRTVNNTIVPATSATSNGFYIDDVDINGSGPVIQVEPGAPLNISLTAQYWKSGPDGYCPGCIVQSVLTFDGVGLLNCRDNFTQYPGRTDSFSERTFAPVEPGVYYFRYRTTLQFRCGDVSRIASAGVPVGAVEVR